MENEAKLYTDDTQTKTLAMGLGIRPKVIELSWLRSKGPY